MKTTYVAYRLESQKERVHLEDLNIGGKIILKWILKKWARLEGLN
jgi:hypothetical protein